MFGVTTEQLAEVRPFQGLDEEALEALASRGVFMWVPEGQAVIRQGEAGSGFYVIMAGEAEVSIDSETVAVLGPGDVFGEMALVEGRKTRRNADVVARAPLTIMTMSAANYRNIATRFPDLGARLRELADSRQMPIE